MNFFGFLNSKESSANTAKDRLTLVLSSERASDSLPFISDLKKDIITVVKKYTYVKNIDIKTQSSGLLEIEVILDKNA